MENVFMKIFIKLLFSSAIVASGFSNEIQTPKEGDGRFLFVVSPVALLDSDSTYKWEVCNCVYISPVFDLFQKDMEFDLNKLDFTVGFFAEYAVNNLFNVFVDYDLIRDNDFDYMVFGLKYSF